MSLFGNFLNRPRIVIGKISNSQKTLNIKNKCAICYFFAYICLSLIARHWYDNYM